MTELNSTFTTPSHGASTVDESFPAAFSELENQLDRLVGVLSSLEDKTLVVSIAPAEIKVPGPPDQVMGNSERAKRMWENTTRLRQSINRLERIIASLDV